MVHIENFDPATDSGRVDSCYQIVVASQSADDPSLPSESLRGFTAGWTTGYNGHPRRAWLASDDAGLAVGCYLLVLPERENPTMAMCRLYVAPARRRSGIGTEVLAHCAGQARQAGRSRLTGEAKDGSPGAAFGSAVGATSGIAEVLRVLTIDAAVSARLGGLRAEAEQHAAGYSVLSWHGTSPDELTDDVARFSAAMADAPRDAGVEPEVWDAERVRQAERSALAAGREYHSVAARHEATGRLAALTQIVTDPGRPGWGLQQLTAVLREHRGHRLGLLVKVAMLETLARHAPDVRSILTGNAASNQHMIAINELIGFQASSVYRSWELDLTRA